MSTGTGILSDIIVYNKYAKFLENKGRRENWEEIVDRYIGMMIKKYCSEDDYRYWNLILSGGDISNLEKPVNSFFWEIVENSKYLYDKKVLMSMRAAQFAGTAIERNESRVYNCAYLPIDDYRSFSEIMFLLLGGTGVGIGVQKHDVDKLPTIRRPIGYQKFLISDSIEGWADSILALMKAYFGKRETMPKFDYSDIRAKGERLITAGGKAPGPDPLRICHTKIEILLNSKKDGEKLRPIDVHDIVCHIADAVLAGGIRRAALISLFSFDDLEMATCKHGAWWEQNPQRGRANNSAVIVRNRIKKNEFEKFWQLIRDSNSGEPGIYFTNDPKYGTNPCAEISLRPYSFCNLTEVNAGNLNDNDTGALDEFFNRCRAATFFGTLQAGFTDFHYLRNVWKRHTEKDALVGVSITGICNGDLLEIQKTVPEVLQQASKLCVNENERIANIIGINGAARVTTLKPSGTAAIVLGVSSGIHAWHSKYYIRNIQCRVGDDLYNYFNINHPNLIKIMDYDPNSAVIGIPIKAPEYAILRETETALEMLERVKLFNIDWVKDGHNRGPNTNNVSATISVKEDEWEEVKDWLWNNKHTYNGISLLPYDGGTYKDAPFQECTKEEYEERLAYVSDINISNIEENDDNTDLQGELACAGGSCELVY